MKKFFKELEKLEIPQTNFVDDNTNKLVTTRVNCSFLYEIITTYIDRDFNNLHELRTALKELNSDEFTSLDNKSISRLLCGKESNLCISVLNGDYMLLEPFLKNVRHNPTNVVPHIIHVLHTYEFATFRNLFD